MLFTSCPTGRQPWRRRSERKKMADSGLKLARRPSKSPQAQYKAIQAKTIPALRQLVSEDVRRREAIVNDWQPEHRPHFESVVNVTAGGIRAGVFISNAGQPLGDGSKATVGDLWEWWNRGTQAHEIVASGGGVLSFEVGGERVFARQVHHPGTPAHNDDTQATQVTAQNAGPKIDRGLKAALNEVSKNK